MSQENVEIVREFLDAQTKWLRRHSQNPRSIVKAVRSGDLDADARKVFTLAHPDLIWNTHEFGSYRGQLEIAAAWDAIFEVADSYAVSTLELVDCGGDRVFAAIDRTVTAKGSGIQATFPIFVVVKVKDGLITQADEYAARSAALEAAGLRE